jgi:hypothetical protein
MVNVRALANNITSGINPNISVTLRAFQAYSVLPSGKATPSYAAAVTVVAQVQALSKREIQHLDAMNISNCERGIYINGQLQAFDRLAQSGGDFLFFENQWWRVDAILEGWTTAGWCRAALTRQMSGPA